MRYPMKRSHFDDIRLFRDRKTAANYLVIILAMLVMPFVIDGYMLSQITFIFIFSIAAIGLTLLVGCTGQISMGHAAFFAIGSYTSAIMTNNGISFIFALPAAGFMAGLAGIHHRFACPTTHRTISGHSHHGLWLYRRGNSRPAGIL